MNVVSIHVLVLVDTTPSVLLLPIVLYVLVIQVTREILWYNAPSHLLHVSLLDNFSFSLSFLAYKE